MREWENSKAALIIKRRRCSEILRKDPDIELEALVERLGVEERSVLRWRAAERKRRSKSRAANSHNRPRRRRPRLL